MSRPNIVRGQLRGGVRNIQKIDHVVYGRPLTVATGCITAECSFHLVWYAKGMNVTYKFLT